MRLNPNRASSRNVRHRRERQVDHHQHEQHRADDQRAVPRLREVRATPERLDGRDAAAQGEHEPDDRFEDRADAAELRARHGVVRGLLLFGELDLPGELLGHAVAMRPHGGDLP